MKILIPGLKYWPLHHEIEHTVAEAMRAAGHQVLFLGCSPGTLQGCECVDRAVREQAGSHRAFCEQCATRQKGVHRRAGFRELSLPLEEAFEQALALRLSDTSIDELLTNTICGVNLREILLPSLHRFSRSMRRFEETVHEDVIREYAATALRIAHHLPKVLRDHDISTVFMLNGLFFAERVIQLVARSAGVRVVNYERGHIRDTLVLSDTEAACFLESSRSPSSLEPQCRDLHLLDEYLRGRSENRDASTHFGTGRDTQARDKDDRPLVAVFTNVCWDSSVTARGSGFGGYEEWLQAIIEMCRQRPSIDFCLRIHPGEARLEYDLTHDQTTSWLRERGLPSNLEIIPPESSRSSYDLMDQSVAAVVYVSSVGLEMACRGGRVICCGDVHYAGRGFTREVGDLAALLEEVDAALGCPDDQEVSNAARVYADGLFLDRCYPFPWVIETRYGHPQRICGRITPSVLKQDTALQRLIAYICSGETMPVSLRELVDQPSLCALPFSYGSRPWPRERVAVIMPAYQRPDRLRRALLAWSRQTLAASRFQLIIIDDGSQPPLVDVLQEVDALTPHLNMQLVQLEENGGPARARNVGIATVLQQANPAELVLFVGDDIEPAEDCLERLLQTRRAWGSESVALLGQVDWPRDLPRSRTMDLVQRNGMQFAFAQLPPRAMLPANYFYTCLVAVPTQWLRDTGCAFNEGFPYAAWEDVEFACRQQELGLKLAYDASVRAYHNHPMDYVSFTRRQRNAGASARMFALLTPKAWARMGVSIADTPPDSRRILALERALRELEKLDLHALEGLPGSDGSLARQLSREQDRLLEMLFRMYHTVGWYEEPLFPSTAPEAGLLSVIIPVLDNAVLTRSCLQTVFECTSGAFEVIVVDNGSGGEVATMLQEFPQVRVIRNEENLGFARANNQAAAVARGEILVLLNNDTEVLAGWDLPIREELASPVVGAVGLRLLYGNRQVQHAGVAFNEEGLPWHIHRGLPEHHPAVNVRLQLHAVTGACLGVRRADYYRLHGLDENFINCYEDIDFCLRLCREGLAVVYRPDGVVLHHEGRSQGRNAYVDHSYFVLNRKFPFRPCDTAWVQLQVARALGAPPKVSTGSKSAEERRSDAVERVQ